MKTYICKQCGKEISEVKMLHGYTQQFDDCKCKGHRMTVPQDHYNSYEDMKCPYCDKYPFAKAPISEVKVIGVTIDVDEDIEGIL